MLGFLGRDAIEAIQTFTDRTRSVPSCRIPEMTLHLQSLAGEVVGGRPGTIVCHPKTRKPVLKVVLRLSSIAWPVALVWLGCL